MGQAQECRVRASHTPYTDRATGLLDPAARNRSRFIEIAIRFRWNRPDISCPENGPFLLERRVPGRKSVIAGGVTTCNTSHNTRGGDGRWSARADAVDHAACCIWPSLQASSASSSSTGAPARLKVCRARLMSWAVGGPS
jgi:hypothetical protein